MSKKVYFCFNHEEDADFVAIVKNSWVMKGLMDSGLYNDDEYKLFKNYNYNDLCRLINNKIEETDVTIVLIGENTLDNPIVKFEILKSYDIDNAIIGIDINRIINGDRHKPKVEIDPHKQIGEFFDNTPIYFDEICDEYYDYLMDDGFQFMGKWIENATQLKNHNYNYN